MMIKKLMLILLFSILWNYSFAAGTSTGTFDSIVMGFEGATSNWQSKFLPIAQYIFWTVSLLEFTYQLAFKKLLPGEINKLWVFLVTRIMLITLMAQFVLDPNVYTGIISWLVNLGSMAGGIDLSGGTLVNYSVSKLFSQLSTLLNPTLGSLMIAAAGAGLLSTSVGMFLFGIAGAVYLIMLIMCSIVMLTLIESYFVLFGGMFLMGFAGSSWTMNYWQKYLSYVAAVGVRLMFTALILGVQTAQWAHTGSWLQPIDINIQGMGAPVAMLENLIALLGVLLFDMIILVTFPSKAAAMLNGAVNAGLGEAFGAAAMALSGGKMLAAPAAAAANVVKNVASAATGAGANAKSAAFKAMRQGMKNNIGGAENGGSDSKFRDLMKSQGQTAANDATKSQFKNAVFGEDGNNWKNAMKQSKEAGAKFANKVGSTGSGSSSGSSINMNPHHH